MIKKKALLISLVFCQVYLYAQQDAWIYLTDKENVASSISNPISILTQQSINRKNAQGIPIDERDVPVNEFYISQLKNQIGIIVFSKSKWFNAVHVRGSQEDINALAALSFVNFIDFADKSLNRIGQTAIQNDKFEIEETRIDFTYGTTQNQVEMINAHELHLMDYTGDGIIIAVLDSGFPNVNTMSSLQRLRTNNDLLDGYDFVSRNSNVYEYTGSNHGTKVLSDMAGFIQDQFVGTAPDASYYVFRTEDIASENPVEESYWVEAAERADSLGVHVINSSLGYTYYDNPNYSYSPAQMDGQTAYITRGANIAAEKGIMVVNSAGNSGNNTWQVVGAPADAMNVLTVGGVDSNGDYSSFSSQGSSAQPTLKPDIVARAVSTFVIDQNDNITTNNGTSFSSPIMAGAVACLMQAVPEMSNEQIRHFIRMSASQYDNPDYFLGYGIPNMQLALMMALSVQEESIDELKIFPNPFNDQLHIQLPSTSDSSLIILDVLGKVVLTQKLNLSHHIINTSLMTSGVYILRITSPSGSKAFKLVKS
jgi:hypothetical protein